MQTDAQPIQCSQKHYKLIANQFSRSKVIDCVGKFLTRLWNVWHSERHCIFTAGNERVIDLFSEPLLWWMRTAVWLNWNRIPWARERPSPSSSWPRPVATTLGKCSYLNRYCRPSWYTVPYPTPYHTHPSYPTPFSHDGICKGVPLLQAPKDPIAQVPNTHNIRLWSLKCYCCSFPDSVLTAALWLCRNIFCVCWFCVHLKTLDIVFVLLVLHHLFVLAQSPHHVFSDQKLYMYLPVLCAFLCQPSLSPPHVVADYGAHLADAVIFNLPHRFWHSVHPHVPLARILLYLYL
jgi:hypothetical protein